MNWGPILKLAVLVCGDYLIFCTLPFTVLRHVETMQDALTAGLRAAREVNEGESLSLGVPFDSPIMTTRASPDRPKIVSNCATFAFVA